MLAPGLYLPGHKQAKLASRSVVQTASCLLIQLFPQAGSALFKGMKDLACLKLECCSPSWRPANYTKLEQLLTSNLVGQHIAQDMIVRAVRGHQRNVAPSKPLVLSFHGWTGSGKNFVSQFIADSFYKLGMASQFVHLFIATLHFPDGRQAGSYKVRD